jgi:glycosyltransferase involved in cell wall biosynthesis
VRRTLTVVIPVKDDAEPLRRCLSALGRQTVPPDHIIVVDNNSTDDSVAVAREAGARVVRESAVGIAAAGARGYDSVGTDLIARLDADSVPGSGWIEAIHTAFERHPEVSALTGPATFVDGPVWLRAPAAMMYLGPYYVFVSAALGHLPVFGSNFAMRTSVWQQIAAEVHRGDTLMHDDMDLSLHIGPRRRIRFEPAMKVGISIRPLRHATGWRLRVRRGFHTLWVHWPHDLPWLRLSRRILHRSLVHRPVRTYRSFARHGQH